MSAFDAYVPARYHGGTMAGGPCFTVLHDAETPLRVGYCDSIVEFFRVGPAAGTSAHAMVDPSKAVKMLPDNVVAYAAGPVANTWGWHLEQAGYAAFTREQWLTADGVAQLARVGACLREVHDTWGIPKRWMTDDQLRAAAKGDRASGGMTTHQQIARVLGGTTHTDPETNYPRDLLLPIVLGDSLPGGFLVALNDDQQAQLYNWMSAVQGTLGSLNAYLQMGGEGDKVLRDTYNSATQARNAVLALVAAGGTGVTGKLSDDDLAKIATAVADEQARRQAS